MKVLVINAGSSSLKYQLLDTESGEVMAKGLCERIGIDGVLTHTGNKSDEKFKFDIAMPTHKGSDPVCYQHSARSGKGCHLLYERDRRSRSPRCTRGGEFFSDSVIITEKVLKAIEDCVPLAPLHNPPNLTGIQACRGLWARTFRWLQYSILHSTRPCRSPTTCTQFHYEVLRELQDPSLRLPRHQPQSMFLSRLLRCSVVRSRSCA